MNKRFRNFTFFLSLFLIRLAVSQRASVAGAGTSGVPARCVILTRFVGGSDMTGVDEARKSWRLSKLDNHSF